MGIIQFAKIIGYKLNHKQYLFCKAIENSLNNSLDNIPSTFFQHFVRREGKTEVVALIGVWLALNKPNSSILLLCPNQNNHQALVRSLKIIIYKYIVKKRLKSKYDLGVTIYTNLGRLIFNSTGSKIIIAYKEPHLCSYSFDFGLVDEIDYLINRADGSGSALFQNAVTRTKCMLASVGTMMQ